jgi:hypothetical protein
MAMVPDRRDLGINGFNPVIPHPVYGEASPGFFSDTYSLELTGSDRQGAIQGYRANYLSPPGTEEPLGFLEVLVVLFEGDQEAEDSAAGVVDDISRLYDSVSVESTPDETVIEVLEEHQHVTMVVRTQDSLLSQVTGFGTDENVVSTTTLRAAEAVSDRVRAVVAGEYGYGPLPGVMDVVDAARWTYDIDGAVTEAIYLSGSGVACTSEFFYDPRALPNVELLSPVVNGDVIHLSFPAGDRTISAGGEPFMSACGAYYPGRPALFSSVEARTPSAFMRWLPDLDRREGVPEVRSGIETIRIDLTGDYANFLDRFNPHIRRASFDEPTVEGMTLWLAVDGGWVVAWEATISGSPEALRRHGFENPKASDTSHYSFGVSDVDAPLEVPITSGEPTRPPPGTKVVFTSDRIAGTTEIFAIGSDGKMTRITDHPNGDERPSFSPDGETIVFVSRRQGNDSLFLVNADGTDLRRLTSPTTDGGDSWPAWSPDGREIVFGSDRAGAGADDLWIIGVDGANPRQLTELGPGTTTFWPSWSPDGTLIAFASNFETAGAFEVYTIRPDASDLRRLTRDATGDGYLRPIWFPDGQRLVVSVGPPTAELILLGRDGAHLGSPAGSDGFLGTVTPDGEYLVFTGLEGDLEVLHLESGATDTLTFHPGEDILPSVAPSDG